jgi:hypothetical protein
MNKSLVRILLSSLIVHVCFNTLNAQSGEILSIVNQISTGSLRNNLYALASDRMEGRMTASHGDSLATLFINGSFINSGLQSPYNKGTSYIQEILIHKKVLKKAEIKILDSTYHLSDGWTVYIPTAP